MKTSLTELETMWSFNDLMMAHDVLDAIEEAESRALEKVRHG